MISKHIFLFCRLIFTLLVVSFDGKFKFDEVQLIYFYFLVSYPGNSCQIQCPSLYVFYYNFIVWGLIFMSLISLIFTCSIRTQLHSSFFFFLHYVSIEELIEGTIVSH